MYLAFFICLTEFINQIWATGKQCDHSSGAQRSFKFDTGWMDFAHMESIGKQGICVTTVKTQMATKLVTWQKTWLTICYMWIGCCGWLCLAYMYILNTCVYIIIYANVFMWEWFRCVPFAQWRKRALPVFEGWNGAWGAEGKPPVDPEVLPNASKLAKSAFALAFCAAGGGVRMRFREADEQKNTMRGKQWMR